MRKFICVIVTSICLLLFLGDVASATDVYELTRQGEALDDTEATELEAKLKEDPDADSVEARSILLGYYFQKQFQDSSARKARARHVLSLIENAPEAEILSTPYGRLTPFSEPKEFKIAKKELVAQLQKDPKNIKLLGNTAAFLMMFDDDIALESLEKCKKLDPKNSKWPQEVAQIYALQMTRLSGKAKIARGKKALKELELAYSLADALSQDAMLSRIAKAAITAGEIDTAKKYAQKMLDQKGDDWNAGNNVHDGNAMLGRIALLSDDVEEAKKRLLAAGKTQGSPQLNSFGPNMTLAKELLGRGEKEAVIEYFKLCSKFWEMGGDRLKQWTKKVEAGGAPKFGSNLNY